MTCIKKSMIRCVRCEGRKKLFKVGSIYSYTNTGGALVECPMCLGTGYTQSLAEALEEIQKSITQDKSEKIKERGCKDAEIKEKSDDA
jgi:uncharacterized protein CbrC (UPF0167 family)